MKAQLRLQPQKDGLSLASFRIYLLLTDRANCTLGPVLRPGFFMFNIYRTNCIYWYRIVYSNLLIFCFPFLFPCCHSYSKYCSTYIIFFTCIQTSILSPYHYLVFNFEFSFLHSFLLAEEKCFQKKKKILIFLFPSKEAVRSVRFT